MCLTHTAGALWLAQLTVVAHVLAVLLSRGVVALGLCMAPRCVATLSVACTSLQAGRPPAQQRQQRQHPPFHAGTIAGGRDPWSALALYGQHLAPVPSANEQGLRMLIGLAYREALARRLR